VVVVIVENGRTIVGVCLSPQAQEKIGSLRFVPAKHLLARSGMKSRCYSNNFQGSLVLRLQVMSVTAQSKVLHSGSFLSLEHIFSSPLGNKNRL